MHRKYDLAAKKRPHKRAAKTTMLHSCADVSSQFSTSTMVEKGEIKKKRRTYCVAGAPNDGSYKNNIRITGIPIYHFPKGVAVWPK